MKDNYCPCTIGLAVLNYWRKYRTRPEAGLCKLLHPGHSTSIWVSLYFLTSWPLFPMIYLIFKMFDLFRSWPLQKRSKTKELWLWFLTFFVEVKNERGQTFWKLDKSLGKEVKRSKDKMKNLKQKKILKKSETKNISKMFTIWFELRTKP